MATPVSYSFVQRMVVNELEFLNANVNSNGVGYFSFNHLGDRLQSLLTTLNNVAANADPYLQKCDARSLKLLLDNLNKISFTHNVESKPQLKQRLLDMLPNGDAIGNKYDKELNKILNFTYNCRLDTLNNIEMTHMKLTCVLCYTAGLPFRDNLWYLPNNESGELFATAFGNYLAYFLAMMRSKDGSLDKNVRVMYHVVPPLQLSEPPYIVFRDRINAGLISVQDSAQYQTAGLDFEVCYTLNNKLYLNSPGSQQTELCAEYLELNALPYCLYNATLPDNFALSALNLYKLNDAKKKLKLGNVLFVNTMRTGAKETIIATMRAYYYACKYAKANKLLRVIGNYKGYANDYKLAALDFAILMLVTNSTNIQLKYLTMNVHERMFMELKQQVCRLSPRKIYNVLLNYDIGSEPLTNFSRDAADGAFD
ncbi:unknown [Orgyia pseudotsugata multiple nucleopolyhedrovirus]|uniref:Uncharacterized 48.2 kDa protein n=1 Tax=Orgyia pseudotsugata multicapsid polyhedrosis virus TaxID=262177 RepID=Y114_NPVOP|nr:hypothetical protein OpmnVgp114 [Orgyia pseudotsugata multiple nucleopolyhedrovirus]O10353.1 RecName: Full=Uncharacterized 48.2 kDa protein [Orgyia pseudotsugata multiple nucleopolyhedrovirus]pir/T10383/ hypothetical protein 114 - Orgyia pseudotsugata nuclear polyhedrosis virus [Orgyia pseudotsugata single capsid nuclopolyhedrovirus]AAC59113.1 unknown [Orgyia pseudotsugata multiple nucleopolyhedrovirus]